MKMPRKHGFVSPALRHLEDRYIGSDPERRAAYEEALANAQVAHAICDLRSRAKLTQRELARLVGTSASVISRLEDAGYEGHSLALLRRIASALGRRIEIRFLPRLRAASRSRPAARRTARRRTRAR
ncbi:MAG: helix-turn-helix transcriptional regulator [Candidatus Eiseniibacteriota bacterium]